MPSSDNIYEKVEKIDSIPDALLKKLGSPSGTLPALRRFYLYKVLNRTSAFHYLFPVIPFKYRMYLQQIGWLKNPIERPVLSGVVAVRVLIYSTRTLTSATLTLDDDPTVLAHSAPVFVSSYKGVDVWSANIWLDSSKLPAGAHKLHIHAYSGTTRVAHMRRFVGKMPQEMLLEKVGEDAAQSDAFVPSPAEPYLDRDLPEIITSRPVAVHHPRNSMFSRPIRSILILRIDQLGDVSASMPAMVRIRQLFPDATITVLTQKFVQPILQASGIADEFMTISLGYSHESEERFLTAEAEAQVRAALNGRSFDLAIDLSPGDESQPLMQLCDAHYRVGFKPEHFRFIDFGIEVISRDKINSKAIVNHAAHITMLVQALETAMRQIQPVVPRVANADETPVFQKYGLKPGQYAVIHSGARHPINQWPMENFMALARDVTDKHGMPVVFFSDNPLSEQEKRRCGDATNVIFLERVPAFEFDILISHARLFVGNDTGPKHLAAIRGVPNVVSVSIPRLNWQEWGQNRGGVIVTRQVPCAGCGINNLAQCGKEAICIRSIPANDVIAVVDKLLNQPSPA